MWLVFDMVRMLISEFQADTTLQDKWGCTPLHEHNYWGGRKLPTEFGFDTTIITRDGKTPESLCMYRLHRCVL